MGYPAKLSFRRLASGFRALLLVSLLFIAPPTAAQENPTGLPLPRFVTTRSTPINVRVGPGTRYDVAWVYLKAGTPVEIIQEFDTWRKVRDFDGSEGWIHQNLLQGKRAGLVRGEAGAQIPLYSGPTTDGGVRAYVVPGFQVDIAECDGSWCEVSATDHPAGGRPAVYSGYLPQSVIWGVYENETFN